MIHIREIIKHLDYKTLLENKIIPVIEWSILGETDYKGKYPTWLFKSNDFGSYGYFIDCLIRKMLVQEFPRLVISNGGQNNEKETWQSALPNLYMSSFGTSENVEEVKQYYGSYTNMYKWLQSIIPTLTDTINNKPYDNDCDIELAPEYNYKNITSHPDLVVGNCVLDIKTTTGFEKMEEEAILQVLSYVSVMRYCHRKIDFMGVLLPMQRQIRIFDVSQWVSIAFMNELLSEAIKLQLCDNEPLVDIDLAHNMSALLKNILPSLIANEMRYQTVSGVSTLIDASIPPFYCGGSHIQKLKGSISYSLQTYYQQVACVQLPCQMFIRPNRNGNKVTFDDTDLVEAAQMITNGDLKIFFHAPYFINLCNPKTSKPKENEGEFDFCLGIVQEDLKIGATIGASGVVIHLGKSTNQTKEEAMGNMKKHILTLLESATVCCPLLLETCVGATSELCTTFEELYDFYFSFTPEQRRKFGICVDSCHCFQAGYEPDDYLMLWLNKTPEKCVKLIHFNNSALPKGSRKDRHAPVRQGFISTSRMKNVSDICIKHNIPMVRE